MEVVNDVRVRIRLQKKHLGKPGPAMTPRDDRVIRRPGSNRGNEFSLEAVPAITILDHRLVNHFEKYKLRIALRQMRRKSTPKLRERLNAALVSIHPQLELVTRMNIHDNGQPRSQNHVERAIDMILGAGLAVVVDIHPSDEFKLRMNRDERGVEAFAKFWRAFASHLSKRDPEFVFLEVINEPMVEDGYRWYGIQGKLIAAIRAGAPNHTIIASGHRWSGLSEMLFLEPYSDTNIIYNFHFYEPFAFTHQGATWAGPNLPFYKNVPYPSSPE